MWHHLEQFREEEEVNSSVTVKSSVKKNINWAWTSQTQRVGRDAPQRVVVVRDASEAGL